jgi:photosystem II stability/assembly factor-like uncharacterized protein
MVKRNCRRVVLVVIAIAASAVAQQPKSSRSKAAAPTQKFKAIWEPANVKDDVSLRSVYFVSPTEGWVAGGRTEMAGGVVLHTTDAGSTWKVQIGDLQSSDRSYHDLQFLSPTLGWAVQSTGIGDHKLIRSDGNEWKDVGTVAQHRGDYRFVSADVGFVTSGGIARTQDGGRQWQPAYACEMKTEVNGLTRDTKCSFAKLFFLNERQGWAMSNAPVRAGGFVLARTQDGGGTWESRVVLPGEDPREGSLSFTDENHGALLTGGKFFYSTDGGNTWTGATGQAAGKPAVRFADSNVGWAIKYRTMTYTTDGGKHWVSREVSFPASVEAFSLVSAESGYVVGDHGMVYRYRIVPIDYTAPGIIAAPSMR